MTHWVEQQIRGTARRTFCAWALILGLVGLAYVGCARYWMDFAAGAYSASGEDLDAIHSLDAAPHQWLRVTGTRAVDTGIQELEVKEQSGRSSERTVLASYYALEIGDRFLILKSAHGMP